MLLDGDGGCCSAGGESSRSSDSGTPRAGSCRPANRSRSACGGSCARRRVSRSRWGGLILTVPDVYGDSGEETINAYFECRLGLGRSAARRRRGRAPLVRAGCAAAARGAVLSERARGARGLGRGRYPAEAGETSTSRRMRNAISERSLARLEAQREPHERPGRDLHVQRPHGQAGRDGERLRTAVDAELERPGDPSAHPQRHDAVHNCGAPTTSTAGRRTSTLILTGGAVEAVAFTKNAPACGSGAQRSRRWPGRLVAEVPADRPGLAGLIQATPLKRSARPRASTRGLVSPPPA